jgi:hypothetical protein
MVYAAVKKKILDVFSAAEEQLKHVAVLMVQFMILQH